MGYIFILFLEPALECGFELPTLYNPDGNKSSVPIPIFLFAWGVEGAIIRDCSQAAIDGGVRLEFVLYYIGLDLN